MATQSDAPRPRILIIDDQPAIGHGLERMLDEDFVVDRLEEAELALERLLKGERWDAILCDVTMPGVDGVEFHERLVALDGAQAERTLFMSGGGITERTQRFLRDMSGRILEKPFTVATLMARLGQLLRERGGG